MYTQYTHMIICWWIWYMSGPVQPTISERHTHRNLFTRTTCTYTACTWMGGVLCLEYMFRAFSDCVRAVCAVLEERGAGILEPGGGRNTITTHTHTGTTSWFSLKKVVSGVIVLRCILYCVALLILLSCTSFMYMYKTTKLIRQHNTKYNVTQWHLRQLFSEKISCLRWDSNPRHSALDSALAQITNTTRARAHTHTHTPDPGETGDWGLAPLPPFVRNDFGRVKNDGSSLPLASQCCVLSLTDNCFNSCRQSERYLRRTNNYQKWFCTRHTLYMYMYIVHCAIQY